MIKQNNLFRMAIMAVLVLALFSCSKTNKEGRMIPLNASYVMHINAAQMSSKVSWDEMKNSEVYKEMLSDTTIPKYVVEVMNNPENSGIDTKKDMVGFLVVDKKGSYSGFVGSIKDAEKFNTFNKEIIKDGFEKQEDGITYITKKPMALGYNKEKFVYVTAAPGMEGFGRRYDDKEEGSSLDLKQTIADLFKISEDQSLAKNEKFSALMKDNADVHIWFNSEPLTEGLSEEIPLVDLSKFTKGNITTASITFNNGNIAVKSKWYASKELSAIFKKYKGDNIDENMVNRLPATGVNALFAMNFKPEGIKEILKLTGMDGLLSGMLRKETNFSVDDFIKANKGDLLVAVSNIHTKKESFSFGTGPDAQTFTNSRPEADYIFAASINDKPSFNKIIQAGQEKMKSGMMDEMPDSVKAKLPAYSTNDKYFAIGTKPVVDGFLSGSNKNTDLIKLIGGKPLGGYADFQSLMKAIEPDEKMDSSEKVMYDLSLQMWDNAILKGGDFEDGALVLDFTINLKDKNTNSLKQLTGYLQKLAALQRQKEKKEEVEVMDTMVAPPPPPPAELVKPNTNKVPAPKK
jgi:Domain of unknown function (DUF4836)